MMLPPSSGNASRGGNSTAAFDAKVTSPASSWSGLLPTTLAMYSAPFSEEVRPIESELSSANTTDRRLVERTERGSASRARKSPSNARRTANAAIARPRDNPWYPLRCIHQTQNANGVSANAKGCMNCMT